MEHAMKIEFPMKLTFTLEEENNRLTNQFVVNDDIQWTELIVKFADFLNAQYGYDIKEKIVFLSDHGFYEEWTVVGERTISQDAYSVARGFDEDRKNTDQEELDLE